MPRFSITVWASYETEIEAEEMAGLESPFPYYDYCETDEIEE